MNIKNITQVFSTFFIFVFVLGFLIYGSQVLLDQNRSSALSSVSGAVVLEAAEKNIPQRNWQIQDLNIGARSAISVESNLFEDKILFSKNADVVLPIASLTKLMSAIIVLDNYNMSDIVEINEDIDSQIMVQNDLKPEDKLSVDSLLRIMLIGSSNRAAFSLAEKIGQQRFVEMMNQKAKYIGLENTIYAEPTGLSDRNYSTAKDIIRLSQHILKNYPKITEISGIKEFDVQSFGKIINTNELLGSMPEVIGGKTGFTTGAKGCLLLVANNTKTGGFFIYVILGSDDKFLEMKNIISWVGSAYQW
ncbi:MAG: hypothetical protein A2599_03520 [Candidatus Staskawiczbacteria bacterium RIFOXYD1_FULL_39_28]|uniref:Peptidase S11 D-alanyl-D-alanine carboxypeptidase A N-terminal domain-containing protein n=1 Tax=Candidatus Staskawiczbacteria bacterium RIFOXYC1_FULL_38_18 TaxID=1802229 RepID=A0A1G2JCE3_9BACT|nr:MAG: hypothetical protein A2401_01405 [Candidatus Staskawiczbacteria bacterium RIFOXYC1_FULL_38_18]OGZ91509.1 MAG: hypothetical protein A2599_03520 [Candidatus Staskawiczbacteria bacterium RIFOXYD1_FULL_39_28]